MSLKSERESESESESESENESESESENGSGSGRWNGSVRESCLVRDVMNGTRDMQCTGVSLYLTC